MVCIFYIVRHRFCQKRSVLTIADFSCTHIRSGYAFISGNSQWREAALGMRASLCALPMGTPLCLSLYLFHNRESGFIYLPYPFTALSDLLEAVGDAWLLCLFLCGRSSRFYF